ncbi:hypothetical protein SAMN04488056_103109 [Cohaesibacter marisflavi]|uniref:Uncharacterized protein n=1 Tax=Cohaesibacter marisflavi TaxID=655353 RepID=A0A1I5EC63_9HYPH|nr:hypothetical protein SAMN04488056_103109 [Cohaesibacter marisflavi]
MMKSNGTFIKSKGAKVKRRTELFHSRRILHSHHEKEGIPRI